MENNENDLKIQLEDVETGELIDFIYADSFELNGKTYAVLLTDVDDEDEIEMVIMEQLEDENGEIALQTIDEDKEDIIYDYYDELCDQLFDEDDEDDEDDK